MPAIFETTEPEPQTRPSRPAPHASRDCLDQLVPSDAIQSDGQEHPLPRPELVDDQSRLIWPYIIGVTVFHLLIPLAFTSYIFSWWGLLWLPVGNYIFCSMGIGAGFHRLLTHRGFSCPLWFE